MPPIIPLTSDTPRLRQHVSRSPVTRRHANALSTKAAQIRMALRHHERNSPHGLPTHYRSNHITLEANTSESSSTTLFPHYIFATNCPTTNWPLLSPAPKSTLNDLRRGSRRTGPKRTLACISRPRHARSPQRVAPDRVKTHSRLRFAPSTRTISAEGCAPGRNALSPAFRALDTHDLRRGLRRTGSKRTLACVLRPRRARSPQRVAHRAETHSRLHFVPSTRTISAEGCAGPGQNALSPAFRAPDTHDLRRGWPAPNPKRTLACISRPQHARSPQRVAPDRAKTHSRLHFAPSTRTISAEGCAGPGQIALSPAFRALDTHDLRRGLRFVVLRLREKVKKSER